MAFNIRQMKESDIDIVFTIETNVHIAPWSKEILRDCVLVGYDCRVLEIIIGDNTILGGYIICRHDEDSFHILNFCIDKPIQSKGYGRTLLQTVLYSLSKYTQFKSVILEVRPSNAPALHLYESLGFIQVELKIGYYTDNSNIEDAIVLKKMIHV